MAKKSEEECQIMIQKSFRSMSHFLQHFLSYLSVCLSCQFSLTAPMVRFLRERLEKAGCIVEDNFFKAITCNQEVAGSYVRGEGVPISFLSCITASLFCSW